MRLVCAMLVFVVAGASGGYEQARSGWKSHFASEVRNSAHEANHKDRHRLELLREPRKPKSFNSLFDLPILNTPPPRRLLQVSVRARIANREHRDRPQAILDPPRSPKSAVFTIRDDLLKAEQHHRTMLSRTRCSVPREQVVCVKDLYPETDIKYHPACTLLHRCDGSSGCCEDPSESCQSHSTQQVVLYFRSNIDSDLLKLAFTNHTACRCQQRHQDQLATALVPTTSTAKTDQPDDYDLDDLSDLEENILSDCPRCPKPFNKRLVRGVCVCDCFDSDKACLAVKRGREPLTNAERRCVHSRVCQKPRCDEGTHFDVYFGQCRTPIQADDSGNNDEYDDDDHNREDAAAVEEEEQQDEEDDFDGEGGKRRRSNTRHSHGRRDMD